MPPSPLDTARELAAQVRSCAATIEADRALPAALFEALADAGLFHRSCRGRWAAPSWTCRPM